MNLTPAIDAAERVGWTAAQTFAGYLVVAGPTPAGFDWRSASAAAGVAALLCLLKVTGTYASTAAALAQIPTAPTGPFITAPVSRGVVERDVDGPPPRHRG